MKPLPDTFAFDEWMALARSDPEAFEQRREHAISETIARLPQAVQPRLSAFQWRIDMERARASNPLSACLRLCSMMRKMVYGDNGLMSAIGALTATGPAESAHFLHTAEIVAFKGRQPIS